MRYVIMYFQRRHNENCFSTIFILFLVMFLQYGKKSFAVAADFRSWIARIDFIKKSLWQRLTVSLTEVSLNLYFTFIIEFNPVYQEELRDWEVWVRNDAVFRNRNRPNVATFNSWIRSFKFQQLINLTFST